MSVYSSGNVKTKLLEPANYNENISAEFRILEPCLPNLRLIDVGAKNNQDIQYNKLLGAYGCLRSVLLYSGQLLLDGTPNIAQYMAFKKYNLPNAVNRSMSRLMTRNQLGFKINDANIMVDEPLVNNQSGITDAKTTMAFVSVSEYCPLLEKLNVLDPAVFENLRLVIEFEPDRNAFLNKTDSTSHNGRRPRLIMDCLAPGSYEPNPSAISWNAIEHDRFDCPVIGRGANDTKLQPNNVRLNGFNSKLVGRILMTKNFQDLSKNATGGAVNGFGRYASHAQNKSQIQVTINGAQQLPRNGVEGVGNKELNLLNDTWGLCNTIPYGNLSGPKDTNLYLAQVKEYIGQQSYFGMFINQRVKDFQINFTRTGKTDSTTDILPINEALTCMVFAEVSKSLKIGGGQVSIMYN